MITAAEAETWLAAYRQAWVTQSADRIVALFMADATYREKRFEPPAIGSAQIRDYWQRNVIDSEREIEFAVEQVMVQGDQAFAHWRARFLWLPAGRTFELDAVFRLTFSSTPNPDGVRLATSLEEWIDHRSL